MVKLEMEQNFDSAGCTKVATCISAFSDVCSSPPYEQKDGDWYRTSRHLFVRMEDWKKYY